MKKRKLSSMVIALTIVASTILSSMSTVSAADSWPATGEQEKGKAQPAFFGYRTQDVKNWSPETDPYAEMLKAKVPLQNRIAPYKATQANPDLDSDAQVMLMQGDYGNGFFDSVIYNNDFSNLNLNFWQYADYFSPWHGAATSSSPKAIYDPATSDWRARGFEFGIVNIPNPAYTNAAHKNGVMSIACVYFDPAFRPGQTCDDMVIKDENGKFPVADQLIEMAKYFGYDGYFLNQEENHSEVFKEFMAYLTAHGLYTQWYDTTSTFDESKAEWLKDAEHGQIHDSVFVNYNWSYNSIDEMESYAKSIGADMFKNVFMGVENNQGKLSASHNSAYNIGMLYKEGTKNPRASVALFTPSDYYQRSLDDDLTDPALDAAKKVKPIMQTAEYQWMVAERERMFFSGTHSDPTNTGANADYARPEVGVKANGGSGWVGVADFISERSVISGSNFYTNFNTGHGMQYFLGGNVATDEEWSNINIQDILPTWQWWMDSAADTKLSADFDYGSKEIRNDVKGEKITVPYTQKGAYKGGSSLVVYGDLSAKNELHLYKTELDVTASSKLNITFQKSSAGSADMKVSLVFKDDTTPVEISVPNSAAAAGWTTETLDLSAYDGKKIAAISLVFDGTETGYQMNIGELKVVDGASHTPATPTGLQIKNMYDSKEVILTWDIADYNDVKQYNIYGVLSNGTKVYLGGVYDEIFYVKNLQGETDSITFEVCAVGPDGSESTAATTTFDFKKAASNVVVTEENDKNNYFVQSALESAVEVSFTEPTGIAFDHTELTVVPKHVPATSAAAMTATVQVAKGTTKATVKLTDVKEGYDYDLYITPVSGGSPVGNTICYRGRLKDAYALPYTKNDIYADGKEARLMNPEAIDWQYLDVNINGEKQTQFKRGASKYFPTLPGTCEFEVVITDYSGNKSDAAKFYLADYKLVDESDVITANEIPDAVLLAIIKEQVGITKDQAATFTGTLDLSNSEVTDLTGINTYFTQMEGLNISGCTKLVSFDISGMGLQKLICEDPAALTGITSASTINISGNKLDLSEGTEERALINQVLAVSGNITFNLQKPISHPSTHFLPAEPVAVAVGESINLDDYKANGKTHYGNDFLALGSDSINGVAYIDPSYDLSANLPKENWDIKITTDEGQIVSSIDTSKDGAYTVYYINQADEADVYSMQVLVGEAEASKLFNLTRRAKLLTSTESTSSWYNGPENMFDGNESSYWNAKFNGAAWAAFDLGKTSTVKSFKLINYDQESAVVDYELQTLKDASATEEQIADETYLSNDANWTTVKKITGNTQKQTESIFIPAVSGRVFRIYISKEIDGVYIRECQLWGLEDTEILSLEIKGENEVMMGKSSTYTAEFDATGDYNNAVTWSITSEKSEGTTIDENGLLTIAADETASSVTIKAVSVADAQKFAEKTINVISAVPAVSITTDTTELSKGDSFIYIQSKVTGDVSDKTLEWSLTTDVTDEGTGLYNSSGSYNYISIGSDETAAYVIVRAALKADPTVYDELIFTIPENVTGPIILGVEASAAANSVEQGTALQFTSAVTGIGEFDKTVIWSITSAHKEATAIDSTGLLTVAADEDAATLTIRATATGDATKFAEYTVTVTEGSGGGETTAITGITGSAAADSVKQGSTLQFTAAVSGTGNYNKDVEWNIVSEHDDKTTIDSTGFLTVAAEEKAETLVIRATAKGDSTKTVDITVSVTKDSSEETDNTIESEVTEGKGKIEFSNSNATSGDAVTISVTPENGFEVEEIVAIGKITGTIYPVTLLPYRSTLLKYQLIMPDEPVTIKVTFKKAEDPNPPVPPKPTPRPSAATATFFSEYSITATAGEGGSITPAGETRVKAYNNQTFEVKANTGYEVDRVVIDGTKEVALTNGSYTFESVSEPYTFEVFFKKTSAANTTPDTSNMPGKDEAPVLKPQATENAQTGTSGNEYAPILFLLTAGAGVLVLRKRKEH